MPRRRIRTVIGGALVGWLALGAVRADGQSRLDSLRARDCAMAIRIVREGQPEKRRAWAWSTLPACGPAASVVARDVWLSQRTERDTAQLEDVFWRLWSFRDASLFDAAMGVAGDASATPQSRVYSAMMLLEQLLENEMPHYKYFIATGEFDVCRIGNVFGREVVVGAPLPSDARARAHSLARSLAANPSAPAEVRSAGRCLDQALTIDDRIQAKKPIRPLPP